MSSDKTNNQDELDMGRPSQAEKDAVADRLHQMMREMKLVKKTEFAERLGVTRSKLGNWMSAHNMPSTKSIFQIEALSGYSAQWIAFGEGPKMAATRLGQVLANQGAVNQMSDEELVQLDSDISQILRSRLLRQ